MVNHALILVLVIEPGGCHEFENNVGNEVHSWEVCATTVYDTVSETK